MLRGTLNTVTGYASRDGAGPLATAGEVPDGTRTVFWIASLTKAVVSVAILRHVERGTVALDQPAAEILPALRDRPVLTGFGEDGAPLLRPAARAITIRHLLTHTSGFVYPFWNEAALRYAKHAGIPPLTSRKLAALDLPLMADPGTAWDYGISTDQLGLILQVLHGAALDRVLQDVILDPLGMTDTSFAPTAAQQSRILPMRTRTPGGDLAPMPFGGEPPGEFLSGGGGLWSTVPDYLRFLRMLLRGGELDGARILAAATVAAMAEDQLPAMGIAMRPLVGTPLAGDPTGLADPDVGFGLGLLVHRVPGPAGRSAGSLSWSGMANCYYWIDPARDVAAVSMTQILPFYDHQALADLAAFERGVYAHG